MNKFLSFIIGLLCGAIITTIGFIFYIRTLEDFRMIGPNDNNMVRPEGEFNDMPFMENNGVPPMPMDKNGR